MGEHWMLMQAVSPSPVFKQIRITDKNVFENLSREWVHL